MSSGKSARRKASRKAKFKRRRMRASGEWKHLHRRKQKIRLKKQGR